MFRIDGVFEAVIIEHPDRQDVLAVVPDRQHEPAMIDVIDGQIADTEYHQVRTEIESVSDGRSVKQQVFDCLRDPPSEHQQRYGSGSGH